MSSERLPKRARQACEPCRRKKTRCTGERPACTYCTRLGQQCFYADIASNQYQSLAGQAAGDLDNSRQWQERIESLEAKLVEVMENQQRQQSVQYSRGSSVQIQHPPEALKRFDLLPSWEILVAVAELYLIYCDCQPLPLFEKSTLVKTLRDRDPEIIFSILALTIRFSDDPLFRDNLSELTERYSETARNMVLQRVSDGPIELSTLQSLCLLSLVDFTNGNTHRASIHSSLAMSLAFCAGLTSEPLAPVNLAMCEERRRCFWSIFLLKRLHGADFSVLDFSGEDNFPWYPKSSGKFAASGCLSDGNNNSGLGTSSREEAKDVGIVAYAIQLSAIWFKTTRYARRRGKPSILPPWSPRSEYSVIMTQQMEFETRMPYIHRFKPANFVSRSSEELHSNRDYWGPWLFIQFLYHTNLCLLNHPLILSLRLRDFKCVIPEIFLQHTSDLISSHASWIIHFIDILEAKSFKASDPFIGHCAAIVATIHLQESFNDNPIARQEHQVKFAKCLSFIRGFENEWPHIARMADNLQKLQSTVSASYQTNANPQTPNRGLLIDLGRFWEILEYSSASELLNSPLFGPSLYTDHRNATHEVSNMSALPEPTRLGSASMEASPNVSVRDSASGAQSAATMDRLGGSSANSDSGVGTSGVITKGNIGVGETPLPYNEDELAILAKSLFDRRTDFTGQNQDWWSGGNL